MTSPSCSGNPHLLAPADARQGWAGARAVLAVLREQSERQPCPELYNACKTQLEEHLAEQRLLSSLAVGEGLAAMLKGRENRAQVPHPVCLQSCPVREGGKSHSTPLLPGTKPDNSVLSPEPLPILAPC